MNLLRQLVIDRMAIFKCKLDVYTYIVVKLSLFIFLTSLISMMAVTDNIPDQNILQFHFVFLCVASSQLLWYLVTEPHTPVHGLSFQDTALSADDAEDQVDQSGKCLDPKGPSASSIVNAVDIPETILYSLHRKKKNQ